MNTYSFSIRIKLILVVVFTLCTMAAFATPPGWDEDEESGVNDEADSAPIDGLIYLGVAAGAVYGYRAITKKAITN